MEFKRISDDSFKCIIDESDMAEFDLGVVDFMNNSGNMQEFLHSIVERASDEVGYKPSDGMIAMQVIALPKNRYSIVVSSGEKNKISQLNDMDMIEDMLDSQLSEDEADAVLDKLKAFGIGSKSAEKKLEKLHNDEKSRADSANSAIKTGKDDASKTGSVIENMPDILNYGFRNLDDLLFFASTLPSDIKRTPKISLYKDTQKKFGYEYVMICPKGSVSKVNYGRVCVLASDYGTFISSNSLMKNYLEEHCEKIISEVALKTLSL